MAAGRDTKRATKLIRQRQRERNRKAAEEADRRRSRMEARAEMTPAERRADDQRIREEQAAARRVSRKGHRVISSGVKQSREPVEDKMAREEPATKQPAEPEQPEPESDGLEALELSDGARKLAKAEGLTVADFAGVEPTGATGYIKRDVKGILSARGG